MFKANDRTTRGFGKSAVLVAVALACVLLALGCNKLGGSMKNDFDPKVKPANIPSQVHSYTLRFTGTEGVTLSGVYQLYQPDGTESGEVWTAAPLPLIIDLSGACIRGVAVRGGDPGTLDMEILRDGIAVQRHSCSLVPGAVIFRYPEDQG